MLYFVPSVEGQLILIVITGVLFFAFRNVQYAHATMFITLLVLLCFNRLKQSSTSRVMNIVAWAYCTLRKAKNSTPVITMRISWPSTEGTK